MKIHNFALFLLLFYGFFALPAQACSCKQYELKEYAESADLVFIGTLQSAHFIKPDPQTRNQTRDQFFKKHNHWWRNGTIIADFEVIHTIKGKPNEMQNITTGKLGGDCGLSMDLGFPYLIFTTAKHPTAHICNGSRIIYGKNQDQAIKEILNEVLPEKNQ